MRCYTLLMVILLHNSSLISIAASVLDMVLPDYYLSIGYKMNLMCFPLTGTPPQLLQGYYNKRTYNSCVTIYNIYSMLLVPCSK